VGSQATKIDISINECIQSPYTKLHGVISQQNISNRIYYGLMYSVGFGFFFLFFLRMG
jgi:hypothetical protein